MRACSETTNSTTSAFAFPPRRTSCERRTAVTLENASAASTIAAAATTTAPTAIQPPTPISTPSSDGPPLLASDRDHQARTQGAPICRHIGATEDAAWWVRAPPEVLGLLLEGALPEREDHRVRSRVVRGVLLLRDRRDVDFDRRPGRE